MTCPSPVMDVRNLENRSTARNVRNSPFPCEVPNVPDLISAEDFCDGCKRFFRSWADCNEAEVESSTLLFFLECSSPAAMVHVEIYETGKDMHYEEKLSGCPRQASLIQKIQPTLHMVISRDPHYPLAPKSLECDFMFHILDDQELRQDLHHNLTQRCPSGFV